MANADVSRIGQVNGAGDVDALFLKVFSGEVITQFQERNVMMPLHMVRTITSGKSAQFPVHGIASAFYHTAGEEILGGKIKHAEKTIVIDDVLVAPAFIANIDEAKSHYDVRSVYTKELGNALANSFDKRAIRTLVNTARASETISGTNKSGFQLDSNFSTAQEIIDALFGAAEEMDSKDIPEDDRYALLKPADYYTLVKDTTAVNRDWGGSGSFAQGSVLNIAGINIIKTNHLPAGVVAAESGEKNANSGDYSLTKACVFHKSAIGTLKLMDLAMESEYQISRQGHLFVAKYAMGTNGLRPEAAVEIKAAA